MGHIIGLTGLQQAGKDTAAEYLIEHCGFQRLAFADALKDIIEIANPIIHVEPGPDGTFKEVTVQDALSRGWTTDQIKTRYVVYRKFMKRLATEGVRKYDPDFWVKVVLNQITDTERNYIITDVRFPNEADALRSLPGGFDVTLWHIQSDRAEAASVDGHESEHWAGKLQEEITIHNNGTLADYMAAVAKVARDSGLHLDYQA